VFRFGGASADEHCGSQAGAGERCIAAAKIRPINTRYPPDSKHSRTRIASPGALPRERFRSALRDSLRSAATFPMLEADPKSPVEGQTSAFDPEPTCLFETKWLSVMLRSTRWCYVLSCW